MEATGLSWLMLKLWGGAGVELTKLNLLCLAGEGRTAPLTRLWMRELSLQKEASLAALSSWRKTSSSARSFSCLLAIRLSLSQKLFSTESERL